MYQPNFAKFDLHQEESDEFHDDPEKMRQELDKRFYGEKVVQVQQAALVKNIRQDIKNIRMWDQQVNSL